MRKMLLVGCVAVVGLVLFPAQTHGQTSDLPSAVHHVIYIWQALNNYCWEHGEYPDSLEELPSAGDNHPDPWGEPLSYTKTSDGFKLYSNGPDRLARTSDDIYRVGEWRGCKLIWDDYWKEVVTNAVVGLRDRTLMALDDLGAHARSYYAKHGEYPEKIPLFYREDPEIYGCVGFINVDYDPWGNPYVYRKLLSGYQLFSAGPDGKPDTSDDIQQDAASDLCGEPSIKEGDVGETICAQAHGDTPPMHDYQLSVPGQAAKVRRRGCGCSFVGAS